MLQENLSKADNGNAKYRHSYYIIVLHVHLNRLI